MRLDTARAWLSEARRVPSPNRDARPERCDVELIVIHGISLPPGEFGGPWIDALFTNRLDPGAHPYFRSIAELRVSAHVLIRRDGELVQYVPLRERAWHCGESSFDGRSRCNDFSIGVEVEGADEVPYEDAQYEQAGRVCSLLMSTWPALTRAHIVAHSDIAPGRKTDPGPAFDWRRLHAALEGP